jgi:TetR/AcrR family transcriptional regulator, cholesterol catabolism regulator
MIKTKVRTPDLVRRRQRQIFRGAVKVCRKKGFHGATVRDIAKASGMSLGSVYDYIEKKEDILFLIHKEVLDQIYAKMDDVVRRYDEPVAQLRHVFTELFELTLKLREEMLLIYTETKSLHGAYLREILNRESEFVGKYTALIEQGVRRGVFRCKSPDLLANILVFVGSILPLRGWNILPRHGEDDVCEMLQDMVLKYLEG